MKLQVSLCAFAALSLWANVSNACGSAHDPALLDIVEQETQVMIAAEREASFRANAAELAADAHRDAAFASSKWALLLDHEGQSLTLLAGSEVAAPAVEADGFVHRVPAEDENAAAVSPEPEVSFNFDAAETLTLISADLTASIPDQAAKDADALEIGWMPMTAVANAGAELQIAIAAFISEAEPSPEQALDGLEDR